MEKPQIYLSLTDHSLASLSYKRVKRWGGGKLFLLCKTSFQKFVFLAIFLVEKKREQNYFLR
jgi:hypothetical protein